MKRACLVVLALALNALPALGDPKKPAPPAPPPPTQGGGIEGGRLRIITEVEERRSQIIQKATSRVGPKKPRKGLKSNAGNLGAMNALDAQRKKTIKLDKNALPPGSASSELASGRKTKGEQHDDGKTGLMNSGGLLDRGGGLTSGGPAPSGSAAAPVQVIK